MKNFLLFVSCFLFLFGSAQKQKTIYIADRLSTCDKKECMQVKEGKKDIWQNINDTVIGLVYEEGYEYRAKVVVSASNNYSLVKLLAKKKTGYNPAVKLEGKKWVLRTMFDSNNTLSLGDSTVFISIDVTNSRIGGHGVCNQLKGTAKALGHNLTISGLSYTKMKCVDQGNIMEKIVINLLEATNTYVLKGGKLTLFSAKGSYMIFNEL